MTSPDPTSAMYEAAERGDTDGAIDVLFDYVDDLLLAGDAGTVDALLKGLDVGRLGPSLIVAVLAITNGARHHLPALAGFKDRAREALGGRAAELMGGFDSARMEAVSRLWGAE